MSGPNKLQRSFLLAAALCGLAAFGGCNATTDFKQQQEQEKLQAESDRQVGLPRVTNFTEKKLVATLYELRDQANLPTLTYVVGLDGRPRFLCRSIGFGIPYATQFSNPEKRTYGNGGGWATMPQAEPNGLFMPAAAEGTWILMATKDGPKPLYCEVRVIVSSVPLPGVEIPAAAGGSFQGGPALRQTVDPEMKKYIDQQEGR